MSLDQILDPLRVKTVLDPSVSDRVKEVATLIGLFVDTATTATGKATFYNKQIEQGRTVASVHSAIMQIDRTVYAALLALPGVTDYARAEGVFGLLSNRYQGHPLLSQERETAIINHLIASLTVPRALKLFGRLAKERVNNKRTSKAILRYILGTQPHLLAWRAVKYRQKIRTALVHAWGVRRSSAIAKHLARLGHTAALLELDGVTLNEEIVRLAGAEDDVDLLAMADALTDLSQDDPPPINWRGLFDGGDDHIKAVLDRHGVPSVLPSEGVVRMLDHWVVRFTPLSDLTLTYTPEIEQATLMTLVSVIPWVMGSRLAGVAGGAEAAFLAPLAARMMARHTFDADVVTLLPPEVAEGLRGTYHPEITAAQVISMTAQRATAKQAMRMQASAKRKGATAPTFNPMRLSLFDLYVYAHDQGMTADIWRAIEHKSRDKASQLRAKGALNIKRAGIIVDVSQSMGGGEGSKYHPMATALALRNVIAFASQERPELWYSDDQGVGSITWYEAPDGIEVGGAIDPVGSTHLATGLAVLAQHDDIDQVFVITDGYENGAAGRFAEVLALLRRVGWRVPVYQLTPVMSAEAFGAKALADGVPVIPVGRDLDFTPGLVKGLLDNQLYEALAIILRQSLAPIFSREPGATGLPPGAWLVEGGE